MGMMNWKPHHFSRIVKMNLQKNKEVVFQKIDLARQLSTEPDSEVEVIAVTKYVDLDTTHDLVTLGLTHFGENRVDKFLEKYQFFAEKDLTWHFIGSLQRRKVKEVINYLDYFHSLDSLKLAAEIQKRAHQPIKCFLQVNISEEESKHGFLLDELDDALEVIKDYDKIILVGLMTMTPLASSEAEKRKIFQTAKTLQLNLAERRIDNMPFTHLSMGMSNDFEIAIQEGATFVRIGSAFFE